MAWDETRQTMLDTLLARLGLVRRKHYDNLAGSYARLTAKYIRARGRENRLAKELMDREGQSNEV